MCSPVLYFNYYYNFIIRLVYEIKSFGHSKSKGDVFHWQDVGHVIAFYESEEIGERRISFLLSRMEKRACSEATGVV